MSGEGAVSAVVRFICHIPLFIYAFSGIKHWNFVKNHADLLLQPPLGQKVLVAEGCAGPGVGNSAQNVQAHS